MQGTEPLRTTYGLSWEHVGQGDRDAGNGLLMLGASTQEPLTLAWLLGAAMLLLKAFAPIGRQWS